MSTDQNSPLTTEDVYNAFSRLPKTDSYPFHSRVNPEYDRRHVGRSIIGPNLLIALHAAREARDLALSYRRFNVGAALVALKVGGGSNFQILTGINVKPDENSMINGHAEQMALRKVEDRAFNAISVVAVVGETQTDQQSGKHMHTLHPCGLCRMKLAEHPMIDPDLTLIATAIPSLRTIEFSSINGLHAYHRDENPDHSAVHRVELPEMEMLEPFEPVSDDPIILTDSPQQQYEDSVWNEMVESFLLEWRQKNNAL